jgi:hypothetical protein
MPADWEGDGQKVTGWWLNQRRGQGDTCRLRGWQHDRVMPKRLKWLRVTFAPPHDGRCSAKGMKNNGWEKQRWQWQRQAGKMADGKKEVRVMDSHLRHLPSFRGWGDRVLLGGVQMWDQIDRNIYGNHRWHTPIDRMLHGILVSSKTAAITSPRCGLHSPMKKPSSCCWTAFLRHPNGLCSGVLPYVKTMLNGWSGGAWLQLMRCALYPSTCP